MACRQHNMTQTHIPALFMPVTSAYIGTGSTARQPQQQHRMRTPLLDLPQCVCLSPHGLTAGVHVHCRQACQGSADMHTMGLAAGLPKHTAPSIPGAECRTGPCLSSYIINSQSRHDYHLLSKLAAYAQPASCTKRHVCVRCAGLQLCSLLHTWQQFNQTNWSREQPLRVHSPAGLQML